MKLIFFYNSILTFLSFTAIAQSKEKALTTFLKGLNTISQNSKVDTWNHFMLEVETVKIKETFSNT